MPLVKVALKGTAAIALLAGLILMIAEPAPGQQSQREYIYMDGKVVAVETGQPVAPVISGISSSGVTGSGATISWTTNEASDSQVDYGTTTSYGSSTNMNGSMVTSHSQFISGLTGSTLHHHRVKSRDAAGNLATSGDYTFTTLTSCI
jgi:hypothetical protein